MDARALSCSSSSDFAECFTIVIKQSTNKQTAKVTAIFEASQVVDHVFAMIYFHTSPLASTWYLAFHGPHWASKVVRLMNLSVSIMNLFLSPLLANSMKDIFGYFDFWLTCYKQNRQILD